MPFDELERDHGGGPNDSHHNFELIETAFINAITETGVRLADEEDQCFDCSVLMMVFVALKLSVDGIKSEEIARVRWQEIEGIFNKTREYVERKEGWNLSKTS